jgi:hypothetical protein
MSDNTNHYFLHVSFNIDDISNVDDIYYTCNPQDFIEELRTRINNIYNFFQNNFGETYNTAIHELGVNEEGEATINKFKNKEEIFNTDYSYSSHDICFLINQKINRIKDAIQADETLIIDEVVQVVDLFNKSSEQLIRNIDYYNANPILVEIKVGDLKIFAPYFMEFLSNKNNSGDDFISSSLKPFYKSIEWMKDTINSPSFPEDDFQIGRFLEWVNIYKALKETTDDWMYFQRN